MPASSTPGSTSASLERPSKQRPQGCCDCLPSAEDCDGSLGIYHVPDNVTPEQRKDNLIDDLGDRSVRDGRSVKQKLFAQDRLTHLEAQRGDRRGIDLTPLRRAARDFLHGSISGAAGVRT